MGAALAEMTAQYRRTQIYIKTLEQELMAQKIARAGAQPGQLDFQAAG